MPNEQIVASADIHHHYPHPVTGETSYDEYGDALIGFYYILIGTDGKEITPRIGPYGNAREAETAAKRAWETGDY